MMALSIFSDGDVSASAVLEDDAPPPAARRGLLLRVKRFAPSLVPADARRSWRCCCVRASALARISTACTARFLYNVRSCSVPGGHGPTHASANLAPDGGGGVGAAGAFASGGLVVGRQDGIAADSVAGLLGARCATWRSGWAGACAYALGTAACCIGRLVCGFGALLLLDGVQELAAPADAGRGRGIRWTGIETV